MAETTIEWTATVGPDGTTHPGFTFNPWEGCSKVHAGCANCYAETRANRFGTAKWGPHGTRRLTSPANWKKPLAWNRKAKELGVRLKVFCASLADVFEDWDGPMVNHHGGVLHRDPNTGAIYEDTMRIGRSLLKMATVRRDLFHLIDATPHLDWLLLTKRPENIRPMWPLPPKDPWPDCLAWDFASVAEFRSNVWLLTSVSDQASANNQVSTLLECRDLSPVLGLSGEPLLGAIDVSRWMFSSDGFVSTPSDGPIHEADGGAALDWIIAGGESGKGARPMHPDWARSLRDQCAAAGVPFFFKQWGEHAPWDFRHDPDLPARLTKLPELHLRMLPDGSYPRGSVTREQFEQLQEHGVHMVPVGKKAAGRLLDGVEHNGMPTAQLTTPTPGETPETTEEA